MDIDKSEGHKSSSNSESEIEHSDDPVDRDLPKTPPSSISECSRDDSDNDNGKGEESDWTICLPSDSEVKDKSTNEGQPSPALVPVVGPSSSASSTHNYQTIQQSIASTVSHFMKSRPSQPTPTLFNIFGKRIGLGGDMKKICPKRKRSALLDPSSSSDTSGHSYSGSACSRIVLGENSEFSARIQQRNGLYGDLVELWKSKEFSDIVFQCDGGELKAHKLIVSARSEVFRAMFSSGMSETTSNTVKIDDIKLDTMKILVEYMYTGCVSPLCIDELSDLLRAADKYQMNKLKHACFQLLISKLKTGNAGELVMLAHLHNADDRIKFKIQEYVLKMRGDLWKVPEFKLMVEANPMVFSSIIFETYNQLN